MSWLIADIIRLEIVMDLPSPLAQLRAEHANVIGVMRNLTATLTGLDADRGNPWPEAGSLVKDRVEALRTDLLLHFRHEEEAVFPEVVALAAQGAPAVDILTQFFSGEQDDDLNAHTIMRMRLRELQEFLIQSELTGQLSPIAVQQLQSVGRLLTDILGRHIEKEHTLVFPMIERLLDDKQLALVAQRLDEMASG